MTAGREPTQCIECVETPHPRQHQLPFATLCLPCIAPTHATSCCCASDVLPASLEALAAAAFEARTKRIARLSLCGPLRAWSGVVHAAGST
jgi:hypothetical protein